MSVQSFVYFITTPDRSMVKIGCSHAPIQRLDTLQTWSPVKLVLAAYAPGTFANERIVQATFRDLHSHREWFRASVELLALIDSIGVDGVLPAKYSEQIGAVLQWRAHAKSPETIAKLKASSQARWTKIRRERSIISRLSSLCAADGISIKQLNERIGAEVLHHNIHGNLYVGWSQLDAAEEFIAAHDNTPEPAQTRAA